MRFRRKFRTQDRDRDRDAWYVDKYFKKKNLQARGQPGGGKPWKNIFLDLVRAKLRRAAIPIQ